MTATSDASSVSDEDRTALTLPFYQTHINKAPIFFKRDVRLLADFIRKFVKYGDSQNIMEMIENGEIRPSKALADSVVGLLNGNQEFTLIDDQKIVFETALQLVDRAITEKKKQVLIVEGGPGTGKSVVAINLLARLTGNQKLVHYVSKNSAPRSVYAEKLKGYRTKSSIDMRYTIMNSTPTLARMRRTTSSGKRMRFSKVPPHSSVRSLPRSVKNWFSK